MDDVQIKFLNDFEDWIKTWELSKKPGLSREIFIAVNYSTFAYIELTQEFLWFSICHFRCY
uniref:Uncharacterized protein n=1 Tax=Lepeophtheirus salmonis TaxID=72036 RepID=A0A0K2USS4_LEPSM